MRQRIRRGGTVGFTLIELLVVVAILALLIAILTPTLGKAREQARRIGCLGNVRQLVNAFHSYLADNRQYMPFTNWDPNGTANGQVRAGWLYQPPIPASLTPEHAQTGTFYKHLGSLAPFRCPGHPDVGDLGRTSNMSSYLMNGAANGYSRLKLYPYRFFKPTDAILWEADERGGAAFNDGASWPYESFDPNTPTAAGLAIRHGNYATIGYMGGQAELIEHVEFHKMANDPKRNALFCVPEQDAANGR